MYTRPGAGPQTCGPKRMVPFPEQWTGSGVATSTTELLHSRSRWLFCGYCPPRAVRYYRAHAAGIFRNE